MNKEKKDIVSIGAILGIIIPAILLVGFILYQSPNFESISSAARFYQNSGIMYKLVSLSLMPGVGLFFLWTRQNLLNRARGILLTTMFYGILVLLLYMS